MVYKEYRPAAGDGPKEESVGFSNIPLPPSLITAAVSGRVLYSYGPRLVHRSPYLAIKWEVGASIFVARCVSSPIIGFQFLPNMLRGNSSHFDRSISLYVRVCRIV